MAAHADGLGSRKHPARLSLILTAKNRAVALTAMEDEARLDAGVAGDTLIDAS